MLAARVLAFKQERRVLGWFHNQLGSKGQAVVEEVAAITIRDAILWAASFEGVDIKQFRAGVFQIARRRRADYLRKRRVDEVPLVIDRGDDAGEEREFGAGDPLAAVDWGSVFNQAFAELGQDSHKLVVLLSLYRFPHKEIAEKVNRQFGAGPDDPMTENNATQIISRFKKRLDELLNEAEDPPTPSPDDD